MEKRYYITKKRLDTFINSFKGIFKTNDEFKAKLQEQIDDLKEFPEANKNQIRFFTKVLESL